MGEECKRGCRHTKKGSVIQKKFFGKTLLVLGSNVGAADIAAYAKENGARVIVADYYPPEKSSAKRMADEHPELANLISFRQWPLPKNSAYHFIATENSGTVLRRRMNFADCVRNIMYLVLNYITRAENRQNMIGTR